MLSANIDQKEEKDVQIFYYRGESDGYKIGTNWLNTGPSGTIHLFIGVVGVRVKVRVGEGKKLPSPKIILASLYVGFKVTILVMYSLRYLCVNA